MMQDTDAFCLDPQSAFPALFYSTMTLKFGLFTQKAEACDMLPIGWRHINSLKYMSHK